MGTDGREGCIRFANGAVRLRAERLRRDEVVEDLLWRTDGGGTRPTKKSQKNPRRWCVAEQKRRFQLVIVNPDRANYFMSLIICPTLARNSSK